MTRVVDWDGLAGQDLRIVRKGEAPIWEEQWRNNAPNPSFEAGEGAPSNVPTTSTMTMSLTTDSPYSGTRAMRLTATTTGALSIPTTSFIPIIGEEYTLVAMIRPQGQSLTATPRIRGAVGTTQVFPADVWTEVRHTGISGSGATVQTGLAVASTNGHAIGFVVDVDMVAVVSGVFTDPPFDGSTNPNGASSRTLWVGTPNASASIQEISTPNLTELRIARTPMPTIVADSGFHLRDDGRSFFGKGPDTPIIPASTIKMMTAYVARLYVTDDMLQETMTVIESDTLNGSSAGLQPGDIVSWDTLFHGMLLRSDSASSHTISRYVGQIIKAQEGGDLSDHSTFRAKANDFFAQWAWRGALFVSSSGLDTEGRITTRQLCELMYKLDAYSLETSVTLTYTASATGPNPRTWEIVHGLTARLAEFPEAIGAKTGALPDGSTAGVVMLFDYSGVRQATAVLGVVPSENRFPDTHTILDFVTAEGA